MLNEQFQLTRPVLAIGTKEGKCICMMIPEHAVVIVDRFRDGERLLCVRWENEELLVFTQDLRERSARLVVDEGRTSPVNS